MKYLAIGLMLGFSINGFASSDENKELECRTYGFGSAGGGISCVSKASIKRDIAELQKIELEKKLLELQIKKAQKEWDNSVSFEEKVDSLQKKFKKMLPEKSVDKKKNKEEPVLMDDKESE